jgi:pyruvate/2-oxoglutarate dehydrogenase complex dihydrolipoamide acyltransferase (E2) component
VKKGNKSKGYRVVPFPTERDIIVDSLRVGSRRHMIHGLVEADVTRARQYIREHKERTGERLSFTAFIICCLAKAVEGDKMVHASRDWRNRLVIFDEVDVSTLVEREVRGRVMGTAHVIRAANKRTFREIHEEIRTVQAASPEDSEHIGAWMLYLRLPGFLRVLLFRALMKFPHLVKRMIGTVSVTAVGMFGRGGGWGIPIPNYTLSLTLGGIAEVPLLINGGFELREQLNLTISLDHDVVDGAPAARFTSRLIELIESGYGLM